MAKKTWDLFSVTRILTCHIFILMPGETSNLFTKVSIFPSPTSFSSPSRRLSPTLKKRRKKNLQAGTIKGYMSRIQFIHKLIFNSPSLAITCSQTSMIIKCIQRSQPLHQDARQPITLEQPNAFLFSAKAITPLTPPAHFLWFPTMFGNHHHVHLWRSLKVVER